jgi:hypothetical protein
LGILSFQIVRGIKRDEGVGGGRGTGSNRLPVDPSGRSSSLQPDINCLEESDALLPGQFPDALRVYVEMVKSREGDVSNMTLAVLHDIRMATLD